MPVGLKKYNTIGCCGIDCGLCQGFISDNFDDGRSKVSFVRLVS